MEVGNVSASLRLDFAQFTSGLRESGQQAKAFESSTSQAFGQMAQDVQASLGEVANAVRDLSQIYLQQKQLDRDLADSARQAADARADAARQAQQAARQAAAEERAAIESVAQAQRDAARATQQALQQQQQRQGNLRDSLQVVGAGMTAFGGATVYAAKQGVQAFSDFDTAMRNVNSIAKLSEDEFQGLRNQVLAMSQSGLTKGPTELGNALYDVVSAGYSGTDALKVLRIGAVAAGAGLTTTATATEVITGTLAAYGMGVDQAQRVSDILFKTADKGKINFEQLAQSLGEVNSTAATAGIPLEEVGGAIALLTAKGVKAPEAVTQIKDAILALQAPSKEAKQTMAEYGLDISETTIKQKGLVATFTELMEKTGGSSEALQKILGNVRAYQAVVGTVGNGETRLGEFTQANRDSAGATQAAAAQQSKAIGTSFLQLSAQFGAFAIRVSEGLVPAIRFVTESLKGLLQWFDTLSPSVQQFIGIAGAVTGAVTLMAGSLLLLGPALTPLILLGEGSIVAGLGAVATAMAPFAGAFAGVAAAAALLYVAWRDNWGGIQQTAATVWGYLQTGFNTLVTTIPPLWESMWGSITTAATGAWTAIQPAVQAGISFVTRAWASISPVVETALQVLVPTVTLAFTTMLNTLQTIWAYISNLWAVLWSGFQGVVEVVWPIVSNYVLTGLDVLKGVVATGMAILKGDWSAAWGAFTGIASDVWEHVKAAIQGAMNGIVNALTNFTKTVFDAGANISKAIADGILSEAKAVQNAITDAIYGGNNGLGKMTVPSNGLVQGKVPGKDEGKADGFSAQGASWGTPDKQKSMLENMRAVGDEMARVNGEVAQASGLGAGIKDASEQQAKAAKLLLDNVQGRLQETLANAGQDKEARKAAYAQALQELQQSALRDTPAILKQAHDYRVSLIKEQVSINEQAEKEQTAALKREAKEREAEQKKQAAAGEDLKKRVQDQRVNDAGRKVDTLSKEAQDGKDVSGQLIDAVRERLRLQFQAIDAAAAKERAAVADTAQNRQLIDEETARKKNALIDEEKQKLLDLAKTARGNDPAAVDPSKRGFDGFKLPEFTLTLPSKSPFEDPTKANPNATPLQAFANSLEGMKTSYTTATDKLTTSMDALNTTLQGKNNPAGLPGAPGATGDSNYQKKLASEQPAMGSGSTPAASGARNADGSYGANLEEMRRQAAAANARTEAAGGSTSGAGAAAAGATSQTIINLNGVEIGTDGKEALTKFAEAAKRKANTSMSPAGGFMGGIG